MSDRPQQWYGVLMKVRIDFHDEEKRVPSLEGEYGTTTKATRPQNALQNAITELEHRFESPGKVDIEVLEFKVEES